nr:MAG TPA: hypothetical protein [Caudoviricetes sp.]
MMILRLFTRAYKALIRCRICVFNSRGNYYGSSRDLNQSAAFSDIVRLKAHVRYYSRIVTSWNHDS